MRDATLEELQGCFCAFRSLIRKTAEASGAGEFTRADYGNAFGRFEELLCGEGRLAAFNIFELCGLGRDEVANCRVLAWWLDKNAPHGLGSRFLEKICELAGSEGLPKEALASSYAARTEICPNGDNANRVDIVCESSSMLLYIEVKIDSSEHGGQTRRYYERLLNNAAGRHRGLLFISPAVPPDSGKAAHISWAKIGGVARDLAAEAESDFIGRLLLQYGDFARKF